MKRLCIGLLAHVDAGKTTLSEAMLYRGGCLRRLGRVDHQDAFLDTEALERERGITIFSKQAVLSLPDLELTLLDTPGHVDFSSEMERTLQVLDYAILVISGTGGVQGHTQTLWRLLARYQIPTFLFVNKMDLDGSDQALRLSELRQRLDDGCASFGPNQPEAAIHEIAAMCDESILEQYLEHGTVSDSDIQALIWQRKLFPCYFGSALHLDGVDEFLSGLSRYTISPSYPAKFGAKVYKIARDSQGNRLTYLKMTGGSLRVKDSLSSQDGGWTEKVDQIRIYSGSRFQTTDQISAGTVCAVTGLSQTRPGQGLGVEPESALPSLEPVLTYQLILPPDCDPHDAMRRLSQLEEEDPQLHLVWDEHARELRLQLMGEIQLEILRRVIEERFRLKVSFGPGSIVYKETIATPAEGVGHFEPLRHYAEVHLLLEPGERGSGLQFDTVCSEDTLDRNWQRLILTHLEEKVHRGVLTGSPITDLSITLLAGRAHPKHTEGGDFRQATYRAVRHGLMQAQSVLLEPYYSIRLELPAETVGRAMTDLQQRFGTLEAPELDGDRAVLAGSAPVSTMGNYWQEVASYTRGEGRLTCTVQGYAPCHNPEEVIAALGYDSQRDVDNPADSVFCAHGAGFVVPWEQVRDYMHIDTGLRLDQAAEPEPEAPPVRRTSYAGSAAEDKELQAIFERTYGPVKRRDFRPPPRPSEEEVRHPIRPQKQGPEYLLVDGYNIIFAWDELKSVAQDNVDAARRMLMDLLCSYQGYKQCVVILVFDAYKVPRSTGEVSRYHNIYVVYTKEAETADTYIERATYEIAREHRVRVATSDGLEQLIILGHGALRVSARAFHEEMDRVSGAISELITAQNRKNRDLDQIRHRAEIKSKKLYS
ncbi:MAG: GTP-binding protein [Oscillospiraceae bacterium]|nr:GTP-binding protein [Oscillospiraceae bacterium]